MPSVPSFARSFAGGEVTPEFWGQIADSKYQTGLALCRNFQVLPHGPIQNRAGTEFVRAAKNAGKRSRLLPFTFSTTQTMVLELGEGYVRFHTMSATLLAGSPPAWSGATAYSVGRLVSSGGVNYYCIKAHTNQAPPNATYWYALPSPAYEIPTPYLEADLFDIHYVQSADVLTLVHPNYQPRELRRQGATQWVLSTIQFATTLAPPTGVGAVATPGASPGTPTSHTYALTTVGETGLDESLISTSTATCSNNLFDTGAFNTITWAPIVGGKRYNVYKRSNGLWGYIGQAEGTTFKDDNILPDVSRTPPESNNPFPLPGGIESVPVTAGGAAYGTAFVSGGAITSVAVTNGGISYSSPTLTVSDPTGSGAVFTVNHSLGTINSITVVNPGSNYSNPLFMLADSAGSGAVLKPTVTPRVLGTPTLQVTDSGGGTGATVVPVVVGGVITDVIVTNPGTSYVDPVVSVNAAAGGSGATFGAPVVTQAGNYPGAVSYFEQRRCFGGTLNKPSNLWMTRSGTESNMTYSIPTRDDDSISFRVVAREANIVRHLVPLTNLVALTSAAEWRVTSVNTDAITPTAVSVKPQSYIGANNAQPVIVNNNLLYAAARGGHMRELAYNWQAGGYITGDLSLRAPHLFDGFDVVDMAYSKAPYPTLWAISSSGTLLGFTYVPEQQIGAWHQHDTGNGVFESVAVVAEGAEDALYVVVRREIEGVVVRYVERLHSRVFATLADAFFVDAGSTYTGAPTTTIAGLGHLEGETVAVLADGAVHPQRVVAGGQISLDNAASKVTVGLPIEADAQTLPLAIEVQGYGQGRQKNVNKVYLRVFRSSGIFTGPSFDQLTEAKQRTTEPYGTPPALQSRQVEVVNKAAWADSGQVCIRQSNPLPLTIVSLTLDVAFGG